MYKPSLGSNFLDDFFKRPTLWITGIDEVLSFKVGITKTISNNKHTRSRGM